MPQSYPRGLRHMYQNLGKRGKTSVQAQLPVFIYANSAWPNISLFGLPAISNLITVVSASEPHYTGVSALEFSKSAKSESDWAYSNIFLLAATSISLPTVFI